MSDKPTRRERKAIRAVVAAEVNLRLAEQGRKVAEIEASQALMDRQTADFELEQVRLERWLRQGGG